MKKWPASAALRPKSRGCEKIAETERNLERIGDLTSVLEEQLEPLQKQAETLQQFRELDGERLAYEGTLTLQELRNSERLLAKVEKQPPVGVGPKNKRRRRNWKERNSGERPSWQTWQQMTKNCAVSTRQPWPFTMTWTA